jgi:hypothetical protein
MSHFVIQANLGESVIFHRETPVQSGVENLINEGLSKLLATTGGKPTEDAYVEVLHYYDDDPTPEVDMIIFADEIDATFYEAETVSPNKSILPEIRGINPEEAYRRIALKSKGQTFASDTMEWDIDYLETYETTYGTKLDGALYNPSTGETAEFEGATIKNTDVEIDPMYQNLEIAPYEAETEELKKTSCCCGATEAEPCLCMYQGVMSCSSVAPKCPCYAAKDSKAVLSKPGHMNYAESQTFNTECSLCGYDLQARYQCSNSECISHDEVETFEAPRTMTKLQAEKKFIAILKPYWLKALKESRGPKLSHKQYLATLDEDDEDYYDADQEDWHWWDNQVKTVQSGAYGLASPSGDTILREALPFSYYGFIESIAGAVPHEMEEKYSYENGYDTSNIYYELCIVDGEPDADNFSAADKRKLAALEKRYDKDLITSDVFFATQEAIFSKYDKQVVHRDSASAAKCRHCGPYIKAMKNINNWNWEWLEYDEFWNECKREKIPTRELKSLTKIILGKPQAKPKAKAKKTTKKVAKAKKTTRKAKPKAKAKTGRKAPTLSATKRKVGTRMRGNDGKMWQVKKSGKSQRWMAGAETQTQTFRSSIDSKFDELL